MLKKSILLFAVAGVLVGTNSFATSLDRGTYVSGNIGYGKINEKVSGSSKNDNSGFAWNAALGYKFTRNFAVELGYNEFANAKYDENIRVKSNYNYYVGAVGILPLANDFSIFGKLGVAHAQVKNEGPIVAKSKVAKTVGYLGTGVGYAITPNISAQLQGYATTKSGDDLPAMYAGTLGLTYLF